MSGEDVASRVRAIVAATFNIAVDQVHDDTVAEDVDGWDSLAHATLILRIERSFNIDLDHQAASEAQDLGALIALVASAMRHPS